VTLRRGMTSQVGERKTRGGSSVDRNEEERTRKMKFVVTNEVIKDNYVTKHRSNASCNSIVLSDHDDNESKF